MWRGAEGAFVSARRVVNKVECKTALVLSLAPSRLPQILGPCLVLCSGAKRRARGSQQANGILRRPRRSHGSAVDAVFFMMPTIKITNTVA